MASTRTRVPSSPSHPTSRPAPLTPADAADVPLRLFGSTGEALTLAAAPFHLAALTTRGTLEVKRLMTHEVPPWAVGYGDSPGAQFYAGAMLREDFGFVRRILERIIAEPLPPLVEEAATRDEIVHAIDRFFQTSGLEALAVLLKNSGARQAQALELVFDAAAQELGTEIEAEVRRLVREEMPKAIGTPAGTASTPAASI